MENRQKYLKYKAKYLQLTNNQTGGLSWGKFTTYFNSKPTAKSTIEKYDYKIGIKYYYYDTGNIITFNILYNGINYVINQVNLRSIELDYQPNNIIYCINLKDNIPHTLLLLSTDCKNIIKTVRVNKRYYESDNYENIIPGIIEQIINKCNNNKGLRTAFEEQRRPDSDIRSTIGSSVNIETVKLPVNRGLCYQYDNIYCGEFISYKYYKADDEFSESHVYYFEHHSISINSTNSSFPNTYIITVVDCISNLHYNTIRSTIGSSVKLDTVNLPINEGLCYKQDNKYYGKFKKYEYDDSRGDPIYNYYFDNGIIFIDPMEKNNNDNVSVVECSRPEQDIPESPVEGLESYEEGYSDSSPEKYSDKVTIDYIKNNQNLCYQYYDNYNKRVKYLGRYLRDERGSGRSDDINYHYFENGDIIEGDIKYFEIVNCGNNRSEV
jgi:hypothetical protein